MPDRFGSLMPLFDDDEGSSSVHLVLWHCSFVSCHKRLFVWAFFGCLSQFVKSVFLPSYTEIVYVRCVYMCLLQIGQTSLLTTVPELLRNSTEGKRHQFSHEQ